MKNIEVKILNPEAIVTAENMLVAMARLTQRGEKIHCMSDLEELLNKEYKGSTVQTLASLPHPTLQKFSVINIAVVGASRRFLSQITRHQNEVKFMSGSLQYSDYSTKAQFCVPYEMTLAKEAIINSGDYEFACTNDPVEAYLNTCLEDLHMYQDLVKWVGRDAAGYMMPQGLRNVLIISATPYQWKHMIAQRTCNRNTLETQYVMLKCWELLYSMSQIFTNCGPSCMHELCHEGKMSCGQPLEDMTPTQLLDAHFSLIR